jgi:2-polyprenyl-3-methyl-5-hydroxy-6-metoxy-1,4-benzoquinol methylase
VRRSYKGIPINTSKNTHETVASLLPSDLHAKILDIPCGAGPFLLRLSDLGYQDIVGVDIRNVLEVDKSQFVMGDMTKALDIEDSSVDTVVCIDGIEHIDTQAGFVKEISRILKNGGHFIISTPNTSAIRSRWRYFWTGHHNKCNAPLDENSPNPLHHISMISLPELRYLLHTNGLQIEEIRANQIKGVSWIFALFYPLVMLMTFMSYRKEARRSGNSALNAEVFKQMMQPVVFFGETLVLKAKKI